MSRESLYLADEVFVSGTTAEITQCVALTASRSVLANAVRVTKQLHQAFFGLFTDETEDKWDWLDPINQ